MGRIIIMQAGDKFVVSTSEQDWFTFDTYREAQEFLNKLPEEASV